MASLRDLLFSQFVSGAENTFLKVGTLGTTVQPLLVSNTNIKTVLGQTLLGSGNITIAASDVPNLDASKITSGTIDAARLPSYVDDVLEYANLAALPATGESGKIYVVLDTNKVYRWSGSVYIEISPAPDLSGYLPLSGGTLTGNITLNAGTANGIAYLNGSKVVTSGSALTFNGTAMSVGSGGNGGGASMAMTVNGTFGGGIQQSYNNNGGSALIPVSGGGLSFYTYTGANASESYSEQMRLTSAGLGIGVTDLSSTGSNAKLAVSGTVNLDDGNFLAWGGGTSRTYIQGWKASSYLRFGISGGEIARFTSTGLGVGTASPTARVHAYSGTAMQQLTVDGVGAIKTGVNFASGGTTYGQIYFDNTPPYDMSVVQQYTTGSLIFGTNSTERARITSNGYLGIGTINPLSPLTLSVGDSENIEFTPGSSITNGGVLQYINRGGSGANQTTRPDMNYYLAAGGAGAHKFYTSDTERLRIDSSGIVRIGNTTGGTGGLLRVGTNFSGTPDGVLATSIRLSGSLEFDFDGVSGTQRHGRIRGTPGNGQGGAYGGGLAFQYYAWDGTTYSWFDGMSMDAAGSLGIGTPTPSAKLDVYVTRTSSTNSTAIVLSDNVTGAQTNGVYKAIRSQSNNGNSVSEIRFIETDGTNNNTAIGFATAPTAGGLTERFRFGPAGQLGIGGANYGTSGQVLTSNGSASAPSWQNATGGGTPGGSSGQVQYNSSGSFAGSANFFWDNGNARLGIGTSSPTVALDVRVGGVAALFTAINGNNNQIGFSNAANAAAGFYMGSPSQGALQFSDHNGIERMRIASNGIIGIGTSSPGSNATRFSFFQPSTPSGTLPTVYYNLGWDNQGGQDNIGIHLQNAGGQVPNGSLLTVKCGAHTSFNLNNSGADNNVWGAGGRPPVYIYSGPPANYSSYGQPPASNFSAAGAMPRMAIYSEMTGMYDGYQLTGLSIRLAGSYGGGSTRDVYCSAVHATTNFGSDRGYGTSYGYYANVSSNTTANYAFYAAAGDAAKPGGGSWASTSDARVKNVIGQYARGLQDVLQINVVDFTYNGKGGHTADGRVYTGVIAQELQPVFPEMVKTHRGKLEQADEQDTDILMVDNSALVYALVNCVKELKAELDQVKLELQTLKG